MPSAACTLLSSVLQVSAALTLACASAPARRLGRKARTQLRARPWLAPEGAVAPGQENLRGSSSSAPSALPLRTSLPNSGLPKFPPWTWKETPNSGSFPLSLGHSRNPRGNPAGSASPSTSLRPQPSPRNSVSPAFALPGSRLQCPGGGCSGKEGAKVSGWGGSKCTPSCKNITKLL